MVFLSPLKKKKKVETVYYCCNHIESFQFQYLCDVYTKWRGILLKPSRMKTLPHASQARQTLANTKEGLDSAAILTPNKNECKLNNKK